MYFPKLSVIIPSLNQGKYIERTILSCLKQDYKGDLEVMVSDGGSKDNTINILKKYPQIIWWSEPDYGFADAVSKALRKASGDIVAIQSSDDYYLPGVFNFSVRFLIRNPDYALVTANDVYVKEGNSSYKRSHIYSHEITPQNFLMHRNIPQHCTFVRRNAIDEVGGTVSLTDKKVDYYSDAYLWYRILHFYKGKFLPIYSGVYQYHANQRANDRIMDRYHIFKKMIELCENDADFSFRFRLPSVEKRILLIVKKYQIQQNVSKADMSLLYEYLNKSNADLFLKIKIENIIYRNDSNFKKIFYAFKSKTLLPRVKSRIKDLFYSLRAKKISLEWWKI